MPQRIYRITRVVQPFSYVDKRIKNRRVMLEYLRMKKLIDQLFSSLTLGKFVVFALIATVFFYGGYGLGHADSGISNDNHAKLINTGWVQSKDDLDFQQFWNVWKTVREDYVDQPVSERDLFYAAIGGIVEGLGDPYSVYFNPADAAAFMQDLEGSFYGIGAELDERDGGIVVVAPLRGTPAERAGVRSGDYIVKVNGESTEGWSVYQAVEKIRGERGTKVTLTLFTQGEDMRDVTITRDKITIDSVTWQREGDIGIIQISQFNQDVTKLLNQAIEELDPESLDGLVLDLRGNPGGLLDEAVSVADFWISDKIVVVEKTRDDETSLRAGKGAILSNIPTVVLVNGGSASASEILAGALQDYGFAHIIGEQTFGKGSVQDYQTLPDGSALKITVAKWFTPKGRSIDDVGIEPDQVVPLTQEDFDANQDTQLEAARVFLKDAR